MRVLGLSAFGLALAASCGSGSSSSGPSGGSDAGSGASSSSGSSGSSSGSSSGGSSSGSSSGGGGSGSSSGTTSPGDSGAFPPAGNPDGSCKALQLPGEAQLVDTSKPTTVVGTGTAASCTFDALNTAVSKGGVVTFDCGPAPVTIPVTATLLPPVSTGGSPAVAVVIDGGNKITLDGQGSVRIMSWVHNTWRTSMDTLTLQRIRFINGMATPTQKIAACPASGSISNIQCSTGYNDGQGGALYMADGNLRVIDSIFEHNQAAMLGPDTGGGALYLFGTGSPSYIAQSSFLNNTASNAGGVGMLWAGAFIFDSLFQGNSAVGTGANSNDATKCTCDNGNNKNQIGSGGNGGAIYKDGGDSVDLTICGTEIKGNTANEFGPAVFLTADGSSARLVIDDSTITGNSTPIPYWQWCTDVSTDNPHASGSSTSSPSPINTTFCNASGGACTMTCSSAPGFRRATPVVPGVSFSWDPWRVPSAPSSRSPPPARLRRTTSLREVAESAELQVRPGKALRSKTRRASMCETPNSARRPRSTGMARAAGAVGAASMATATRAAGERPELNLALDAQ